jgi:hypothetical protein
MFYYSCDQSPERNCKLKLELTSPARDEGSKLELELRTSTESGDLRL